MAAFDFPNSPNTNDKYTANGMTFIFNGSVWKKDASAGVKGEKGQKGDKGQKGEIGVGIKGQKGEDNSSKGQKGEQGTATITNAGNDRVMTSVSGTTLNAESNLTFDGSFLQALHSNGQILINPSDGSIEIARNSGDAYIDF